MGEDYAKKCGVFYMALQYITGAPIRTTNSEKLLHKVIKSELIQCQKHFFLASVLIFVIKNRLVEE
jgi:hypothetical protein